VDIPFKIILKIQPNSVSESTNIGHSDTWTIASETSIEEPYSSRQLSVWLQH